MKLTLYRSVDAKVDGTQKLDAKVDGREQIPAYPYGLTTWFEGHRSITTREAMELFRISKSGINKRLKELVDNKLFDGFDGKLTSSKWAQIAKCSQDTAARDIRDLISIGVLLKESAGGRSTSYRLNVER